MNWHIGQEIVCVESHRMGVVTKDKTYTIKGLRNSPCCNHINIDIGVSEYGYDRCSKCGKSGKLGYTWWFTEARFAPIEYNEEAIGELMEEINSVKLND